MATRKKEELLQMRKVVKEYLSRAESPHDAWNLYIKEHLESGNPLPVYVKGVKDFMHVYEEQCKKISNPF